jgi:hypothetical protein
MSDTKYNPEYADLPFNADYKTEQYDLSPEIISEKLAAVNQQIRQSENPL